MRNETTFKSNKGKYTKGAGALKGKQGRKHRERKQR